MMLCPLQATAEGKTQLNNLQMQIVPRGIIYISIF